MQLPNFRITPIKINWLQTYKSLEKLQLDFKSLWPKFTLKCHFPWSPNFDLQWTLAYPNSTISGGISVLVEVKPSQNPFCNSNLYVIRCNSISCSVKKTILPYFDQFRWILRVILAEYQRNYDYCAWAKLSNFDES